MKKLNKMLSALLATTVLAASLSVTAFADPDTTTASNVFTGGTGTENHSLTIKSSAANHNYILYQVFKGTSSADYTGSITDASEGGAGSFYGEAIDGDTLSNIKWGESIVASDGSYDLSAALVTALNSPTLPGSMSDDATEKVTDSTYANPFYNTTKQLDARSHTLAKDVAELLQMEFSTDNDGAVVVSQNLTATELDAFATIVSYVVTHATDDGGDAITVKTLTSGDPTANTKQVEQTNEDGNVVTETVVDNYTYTFDNIQSGYYMVNEQVTNGVEQYSSYILKVAHADAVMEEKVKTNPTLDKEIVTTAKSESTNEQTSDYTDAAIGDTITFKLSSTVPDMTYYSKYFFVMTDTLSSGLTYDQTKDNMVVKVGDTVVSRYDVATTGTNTQYYKLYTSQDTDGTTTVTIVFHNFVQYKAQAGNAVTVYYDAQLNEKAQIGDGSTNENYNPNAANLTYSNNPNYNYQGGGDPDPDDDSDPDDDYPGSNDPVGKTPDEHVYVYTTGIDLYKFFQAFGATSYGDLENAEFKIEGTNLNQISVVKNIVFKKIGDTDTDGSTVERGATEKVYYKLANGTYTITKPSSDSDSRYESTTDQYVERADITTKTVTDDTETDVAQQTLYYTAKTGADGHLILNGLKSGTYTITELSAPAGYEVLSEPIQITISFTAPTDISTNVCTWSAEFATKTNEYGVGVSANDGEKADRLHVTGTAGLSADDMSRDAENNLSGIVMLDIQDDISGILPSTGGIGTTIFYAVGGTLLLGALVLLITKGRMKKDA